jgi:hypothetical protein
MIWQTCRSGSARHACILFGRLETFDELLEWQQPLRALRFVTIDHDDRRVRLLIGTVRHNSKTSSASGAGGKSTPMPPVQLRCRDRTFDVSTAKAIRAALQSASLLAPPSTFTATVVPPASAATDDDEMLSSMLSNMTLKY